MNQIWRPIVGFEEIYEVSDHGQVRNVGTHEPVRQYIGNSSGHRRLILKREGGGRVTVYVHRVVLEAFEGPSNGRNGLHWDDDATNNHISNLRWGTQSENMWDKVRNGNHHSGRRTHCPNGHLFDNAYYRPDGSFSHRWCSTCRYGETCPQGHPRDGIAHNPDGSVRQRFCKQCRSESVSRQMSERHAKNRAERTVCKWGHPLDGLRKRPGGMVVPYCKTCLRESSRRNAAAKKAANG